MWFTYSNCAVLGISGSFYYPMTIFLFSGFPYSFIFQPNTCFILKAEGTAEVIPMFLPNVSK